ncbi:MAG: hypothetical protein A2284_06805 [Deltaproteobacteria bacterium RIFOXYA12_FULL_61_11]|nr:MAG: hypothetical protein A2284_06805 [Deltaproteobacteria bacterium RIFOXYA12_FULL_61_11]
MNRSSDRPYVLLLQPPHFRARQQPHQTLPVNLLTLAGALRRAGVPTAVLDADYHIPTSAVDRRGREDWETSFLRQFTNTLKTLAPRILGVSMTSSQYQVVLDILARAKQLCPSLVTVVGGYHPTLRPEQVLANPAVDVAVRGEGDETLTELALATRDGRSLEGILGLSRRVGGRIVHHADRPLLADLDRLPILDRTALVGWRDLPPWKFGAMVTSRGCPFHCAFCSSRVFWGGTIRYRSVLSVVAEMQEVQQTFGTRGFAFLDDTLNADPDRLAHLAEAIRRDCGPVYWSCKLRLDRFDERLLLRCKRAGLYRVRVGVESGDQGLLDSVAKGLSLETIRSQIRLLQRHGLEVFCWFILGLPGETEAGLEATLRLLNDLDPDGLGFSFFKEHFGLPLTERLGVEVLPGEGLDGSRPPSILPLDRHRHYLAVQTWLHRESARRSARTLFRRLGNPRFMALRGLEALVAPRQGFSDLLGRRLPFSLAGLHRKGLRTPEAEP